MSQSSYARSRWLVVGVVPIFLHISLLASLLTWTITACSRAAANGNESKASLIAHWPLVSDARDAIGTAHGEPHDVRFTGIQNATGPQRDSGAELNGRTSRIRVPHSEALNLGSEDFSLSVWVRCTTPLQSVLGDVAAKFDPAERRGFNLHVAGSSPAYSSMSDARHLHFGIDDARQSGWEDHGRPWPSNSLVSGLIAYEGSLYCGISDADTPEARAHIFRFDGGNKWVDCGRLGIDPNHHSVMSMIVHDGKLYAGTGIWDWVQALGGLEGAPPPAATHVFVYEGGTHWRDVGQVGNGSRVLCLASFAGSLYAGIDSVGGGRVFRYQGNAWFDCGAPDGRNLECLIPWGGKLYAATHGNFYHSLVDGSWKPIGKEPHGINQVHSMQVVGGELLAGTWPQGYVLRHGTGDDWRTIGRLGLPETKGVEPCNEVMDLTVYNGKLYAGLIPKAEVYRYEADGDWTILGSLARRPDWDVRSNPSWVRVTCLTSFGGRLFAGTGSCQGRALDAPVDPSLGKVLSMQAGAVVSHDRDIGGNWTHVAAIRRGTSLELHVNGRQVGCTPLPDGQPLDLNNDAPLWIGYGAQNSFDGMLAHMRLYAGALDATTLARLATNRN